VVNGIQSSRLSLCRERGGAEVWRQRAPAARARTAGGSAEQSFSPGGCLRRRQDFSFSREVILQGEKRSEW